MKRRRRICRICKKKYGTDENKSSIYKYDNEWSMELEMKCFGGTIGLELWFEIVWTNIIKLNFKISLRKR